MTIALGFTCTDGLVLAADSEISTDLARHDGQKAWYFRYPDADDPKLKVAIVGSGDIAFIRYAAERIGSSLNETMSKDDVQSIVQGIIIDIHINHLYPYPDHITRPEIELIVGMLTHDRGRRLITTNLTTVTKIWDYQPIGVGKDLANFLIKRFYSGRLTVSSAVFLSAQILMHARNHVTGCGGRSRILVMYNVDTKAGWVDDVAIQDYERYTRQFEDAIRPVMFSGPDQTVEQAQYDSMVDALGGALKQLRPIQLERAQTVRQNLVITVPTGQLQVSGEWISPAIAAGDIPITSGTSSASPSPSPSAENSDDEDQLLK